MTDTLTNTRLNGKVAVVTGAAQGIGADIARVLSAAGAHVFLADVSPVAYTVASEIGPCAQCIETDITDDTSIDRCIETVLSRFDHIDLLVNNACVYDDAGLESTREQWRRTLDVNLVSSAIFAQKAVAHMRPGSVIVNMGSTGGKYGAQGRATYPASKAALLQLTKSLAVSLAPQGVRVLAVSPAWTWSPAMAGMSGDSVAFADSVGACFHPLGRVGRGVEIGRVVAFAASQESSWMTGVDLPVDGGFSVLGPDRGHSPRAWFRQMSEKDSKRS